MAFIYGLSSTRDIDKILYIGKSINTINKRFSSHKKGAFVKNKKSPLYNWMRYEVLNGFEIESCLIEETAREDASNKEIHYIKLYRTFGAKLKNQTDGCLGRKWSDAQKKNVSEKMKIFSNSQEGNELRKIASKKGMIRIKELNKTYSNWSKKTKQQRNKIISDKAKKDFVNRPIYKWMNSFSKKEWNERMKKIGKLSGINKKIFVYNIKHKLIKTYNSITDTAKLTNTCKSWLSITLNDNNNTLKRKIKNLYFSTKNYSKPKK